jgi:cell division GTPase FtsZ
LKALFDRDAAATGRSDPRYAERLRRAITTRFIDTNEFSLADVPADERLLIGARTTRGLGARHNPDVARQALEESRAEVEALVSQHSVIILVGTGGKGTGAGTMFPLAQMAREHGKLLIPVFVRPSFERHEVDKRRYDHALHVIERFDAAKIRFIEILNDRGYVESDPQPQHVVWERMNLPLARGLRGLMYVLWDLSQVDPSDLSMLFAGNGRLRMGFAEIDPPTGQEPSDEDIAQAVRLCWANPYYAFSKPTGTSLICIQGDWSNVVDARIKVQMAAHAIGDKPDTPYNPLYARALRSPRPWGITALFAEDTGAHPPLAADWAVRLGDLPLRRSGHARWTSLDAPESAPSGEAAPTAADAPESEQAGANAPFAGMWDFAIALNRSDPAAVALAANGFDGGIPIDGAELRKLVGTYWFRSVFQRLSADWRSRLFDVLREQLQIQNCLVNLGRHTVTLREATLAQLNELADRPDLQDPLRADVHLLVAVGRLWGEDAIRRLRFESDLEEPPPSGLEGLFRWIRR